MKNLFKNLFSRSGESQSAPSPTNAQELSIVLVECVEDSSEGKRNKYYFSLLPPDQMFKRGLIPEAIVGEATEKPLEGAQIEKSKFAANTVFKDFLHRVIESCAEHPAVVAEAKRIGKGLVTVIDRRVPDPNGAIAPEDILGGFLVENGRVTGYSRNPNHVLLNQFGFFKLDTVIQEKLKESLEQISRRK